MHTFFMFSEILPTDNNIKSYLSNWKKQDVWTTISSKTSDWHLGCFLSNLLCSSSKANNGLRNSAMDTDTEWKEGIHSYAQCCYFEGLPSPASSKFIVTSRTITFSCKNHSGETTAQSYHLSNCWTLFFTGRLSTRSNVVDSFMCSSFEWAIGETKRNHYYYSRSNRYWRDWERNVAALWFPSLHHFNAT